MRTASITHRGAETGTLGQVAREFPWGTMSVIALGESGRGRHEEIVPCELSATGNGALAASQSGKLKIVPGTEEGGWLLRISSEGCYTRDTLGCVYAAETPLAVGRGAYGDAGRIGEWGDYLFHVQPGTWLYLRPSGGEGKIPRKWIFVGETEIFLPREEDVDAFIDATGVQALPFADVPCVNAPMARAYYPNHPGVPGHVAPVCGDCGGEYVLRTVAEDGRVRDLLAGAFLGAGSAWVHDGSVRKMALPRR